MKEEVSREIKSAMTIFYPILGAQQGLRYPKLGIWSTRKDTVEMRQNIGADTAKLPEGTQLD